MDSVLAGRSKWRNSMDSLVSGRGKRRNATSSDQRVDLSVGTYLQHASDYRSLVVPVMSSGGSPARVFSGMSAARKPPHLRDHGVYGTAGVDDEDASGSEEECNIYHNNREVLKCKYFPGEIIVE